MKVELTFTSQRPLGKADAQSLVTAMNAAGAMHSPAFGTLASFSFDHAVADWQSVMWMLQIQPVSAVNAVLRRTLDIHVEWAKQSGAEFRVRHERGNSTVEFPITTSETERSEVVTGLLGNLKDDVATAILHESPFSLRTLSSTEIRRLILDVTGMSVGVVRLIRREPGLCFSAKSNLASIDVVESECGTGCLIAESTTQEPSRVWSTVPQAASLNVSLALETMLPQANGLNAYFVYEMYEAETGIQRKRFESNLGPLVVHTRPTQVNGEQATELVIEIVNRGRYLRRINTRFAALPNPSQGFEETAEQPF